MPNAIIPDNLLSQHRDCPVTVWFMPEKVEPGAEWIPHETYQGLKAAVAAIIADADRHFGYDVHVHLPSGADRLLSQDEVQALVEHLKGKL